MTWNSTLSFGLALLLVPIELLSYIFKPISLGVRLFANLMAGHTLLKVIVGFSWSMLLLEDLLAILHILPLLILVLLMGLELGVALIQAYVFTILTCIYLFFNSDPNFSILSEQIFNHSKNLTQLLKNHNVLSSQIKSLTTLISEKFQNLNSYLLKISSKSNFDFSNIKPNWK